MKKVTLTNNPTHHHSLLTKENKEIQQSIDKLTLQNNKYEKTFQSSIKKVEEFTKDPEKLKPWKERIKRFLEIIMYNPLTKESRPAEEKATELWSIVKPSKK